MKISIHQWWPTNIRIQKAKEEFYTASQLSKSEFHNSLKEYTKSYKEFSNYVIERKTAGVTKALTYPCGETQEVFYDLLQSGQYDPLDSHRTAYSRLEERLVLF